jgi:hypothetical protein
VNANTNGIRRTLLINYWFNQTAGDSGTHTLPLENGLMDLARFLLGNAIRVSKSSEDVSNPMIHLYSPRDLKSDFLDWQKQKLPAEFSEFIEHVMQGNKPIPGVVLHFAIGFMDEYLASLPKETSFDHWYRWKLDNDTNILHVTTINIPISDDSKYPDEVNTSGAKEVIHA